MSQFGGQESMLRMINSVSNTYSQLSQEFESRIREGESVAQAFPEVLKILLSMMS
ncbi:hypothetical protein WH47_00176 [Habropoda laboriosa]|uniref:Uncharacterized protein n=1 Tax=Habropoda laboriosa TaxID=597456 RepID=A0A0L7R1G0_9HYME|nr:hypothetical protein WH47_00176 [Habropoda laboriosa]